MSFDAVFDHDVMADAAQEASTCLRALSNPSRLLLLCHLLESEKNVGELEDALGLGQAYVSQQLARLRMDGLVISRREGRMIYYNIASKEVGSIIEQLYEMFCKPVRNPD